MENMIAKELRTVEEKYDIKVLYAAESGSRALGFPSPNSDYDVRFIYVHRRDWYLSIEPGRDVIEHKVNELLDISGWDLKKALYLLTKSNPALLEWLRSPVIYEEGYSIAKQLREIGFSQLSKKAVMYHYLHMAQGNYRDYLRGDIVKVKKYFYVLRPLFVCEWIERKGSVPPVAFRELLLEQDLPYTARTELEELLSRKLAGEELGQEAALPTLHAWIQEKLSYYESYVKQLEQKSTANKEELNLLFRRTLSEVWD